MSTLIILGHKYFEEIIADLMVDDFPINPNLEFCAGDGLLCHYDAQTQTISFGVPDSDTEEGRSQMLLLRSLLDCESNTDVIEFLQHISRWLIAHEIAHHCRHQLGFFDQSVWQEDQIANYLAIAVSKRYFSGEVKAWCDAFLDRATENLAKKVGENCSATDTYHSLPHSLVTANLIDTETFDQVMSFKRQTGHLSEIILKHKMVGNLPSHIGQRVNNRHRIIQRINESSYQNIFEELYYYFGWMQIGLMSSEHYTKQEFSHYFLNEQHKNRRKQTID